MSLGKHYTCEQASKPHDWIYFVVSGSGFAAALAGRAGTPALIGAPETAALGRAALGRDGAPGAAAAAERRAPSPAFAAAAAAALALDDAVDETSTVVDIDRVTGRGDAAAAELAGVVRASAVVRVGATRVGVVLAAPGVVRLGEELEAALSTEVRLGPAQQARGVPGEQQRGPPTGEWESLAPRRL
ncbi:hypothetical protein GGF38_002843 [Coemansia sp. RSA 25]|nr:hypothetical protein GGF38_002843 [Coemansia sp. RSA 25]